MPSKTSSADLRKQMANDAKKLAAKAAEWYRTKPENWGLPTGVQSLDTMTGGLPQDEIIVLAGGPGAGKTSLATQMAIEASRHLIAHPLPGNDTINVFISAEMSRAQVMQRVACAWAQVDQTDLRRGQITEQQLVDYQQALEVLCELPLLVVDSGMELFTTEDIRQIVDAITGEGLQIGMLVVDYLQQLGDEGMGVERINNMLRGLRRVVHRSNCSMLLLSQYAREKLKEGRKPKMEDLLGSGNIERTADQIWALHDPSEDEGAVVAPGVSRKHLFVLKNRNGKKHKPGEYPIFLDFYEAQTMFVDPTTVDVNDMDQTNGIYVPPVHLVR